MPQYPLGFTPEEYDELKALVLDLGLSGPFEANEVLALTWKRPSSGSFHVCLEAIDLSDRGPNRGHSAVCEVVVAR